MVILDKDLVLYLRFGEGSGAKVFDRSKWQNNGIISGARFVEPFKGSEVAWIKGWRHRIKITIDADDIDGDLTDFPILIYLSGSSGIDSDDVTAVFDEVGANSLKIAVTSGCGCECYVEVEEWDNGGEEAWLWVKVPSIDDTVDTILYLYYDNTHADNTDYVGIPNSAVAENVWDNFGLVSHMLDDPNNANIRDSTTNDNDGVKTGANEPIEIAAQIYNGQDFDGGDDLITITDAPELDIDVTNSIAFSFWIKPASASQDIFKKIDGGKGYACWIQADGTIRMRLYDAVITPDITSLTDVVTDTLWHHVVFVYNFTADTGLVYIDGVEDTDGGADDLSALADCSNAGDLILGITYALDWYDGIIDEFRVSFGAIRSASWIKACYETQREHMLTFGNEETYYPTLTDWQHGNALCFDGINDYVEVADDPSLSIREFTLVMWVCPSSSGLSDLLSKGDVNNLKLNYQIKRDALGLIEFYFRSGGDWRGGSFPYSSISNNTHTHIIVTFEQPTVRLYLNGIYISSLTLDFVPEINDAVLRFGGRFSAPAYYHGIIDEVRIYGRILTGTEIRTLYNEKRVK